MIFLVSLGSDLRKEVAARGECQDRDTSNDIGGGSKVAWNAAFLAATEF
jgi:hypothetical protein